MLIAVSPSIRAPWGMLAMWREERRSAAAAAETEPDGRLHVLFQALERNGWPTLRITRRVAAIAAQTGVSVSVTMLRRYSMLRMTTLGVAVDVVARRLGLAGPSSLMFWPARAIRAADREAAVLMADELGQAVGGSAGHDLSRARPSARHTPMSTRFREAAAATAASSSRSCAANGTPPRRS